MCTTITIVVISSNILQVNLLFDFKATRKPGAFATLTGKLIDCDNNDDYHL